MNNFDDIKNLWQNQPGLTMPDVEAIKKAANKNRRQLVIKNAAGILALTGTVIFMAYGAATWQFQYITTKLGMGLIVIGIIGAIVLGSQMLQLILAPVDDTVNNQAYLQQLIQYRNKMRFFQTKGMYAYYFLLTTGFMLYLYEFYARNHMFGLKAYAITLGWIAFTWFYIKPRAIKKQEKKINDLIIQIESISKQLEQ